MEYCALGQCRVLVQGPVLSASGLGLGSGYGVDSRLLGAGPNDKILLYIPSRQTSTQTFNIIGINSRSDLSKILTSLHTSLMSGWFLVVKIMIMRNLLN